MSAATAARPAAKKPRYISVTETVDVDVEIDVAHLEEDGWHHESDCPNKLPLPVFEPPGTDVIREALNSLHRQAHPSEHRNSLLCREEPCRSMPLETLLTKASQR